MLRDYQPHRLIVFSRDELKQHEMRTSGFDHPSLRYFIGDVRDAERLKRAFLGVTMVVHAAALKQVPACEYNPFEAIQTNIMGGHNVIDAAIDQGVHRILALSTDKAVNPINLYGATKLCAEKMFVQANVYAGAKNTRSSCARYGNVVGSPGSVIPVFLEQRRRGKITLTDGRMTRFWLTVDQGVKFVIRCLEQMHGGEIFVPKIPSMRLVDLAEAIGPGCQVEYIRIRRCLSRHSEPRPSGSFEKTICTQIFSHILTHKGLDRGRLCGTPRCARRTWRVGAKRGSTSDRRRLPCSGRGISRQTRR
jgi:UDP-N-acetylglucosamine 4,6-dehydratase